MKSVMIQLQNVNQIKELVQAVTSSPYDIDIASGRYIIDAKSILGIFSLDIEKPMEVIIHGEDCEEILEELRQFTVIRPFL